MVYRALDHGRHAVVAFRRVYSETSATAPVSARFANDHRPAGESRSPSTRRQIHPNLPVESTSELESEFERELWQVFPRHPKSTRSAAFAAYRRLSARDRIACLSAAAQFAIRFEELGLPEQKRDERLKFVPSLATWISQRRWERSGRP